MHFEIYPWSICPILQNFSLQAILLLQTQRSSCAGAFLILAGNLIHQSSILACYLMHVVLCHTENLMGKQFVECDCDVVLVAATRVSKSRWNCDWTGNICKKRQSFNYTVVAAIFLTATIISGSCLSNSESLLSPTGKCSIHSVTSYMFALG